MSIQRYHVNQHPIQIILSWVNSGNIAIPEIQRPFVWDATKVRDFLDSLYNGYPVGYLIAWRNPDIKLKDGSSSEGKRILIDGQQRVTALNAAILGNQVLTKDYQKTRIRIAFHPKEKKFEVSNPAIEKDVTWIPDVSTIFSPEFQMFQYVNDYCQKNPSMTQQEVFDSIQTLMSIVHNPVGLIDLNPDLDIETVTEIFIRINSQGVVLSQADFAMSKIATNETYGGNLLRKSIDYFCHMAVSPEFHDKIVELDPEFVKSEFFPKMSWLRKEIDDIYDPSYTDMLRVSFTSQFKRGRLQDLVALLSGRNFETKQYEELIAEQSFNRLKEGVHKFINETNFKKFVMIIRSAGFVDSSLIGSQNALNFAYILYLTLREQGLPQHDIESWVRRWFVMSTLTGRYSASPESAFDYDIRQIYEQGFPQYAKAIEAGELSDAYWDSLLPQEMNTSVASSPYFRVYQAAQIKINDRGFLSRDITVQDLILNKSDVHHIFPRNYLKKLGMTRGRYNQIANYVLMQNEINIAIRDNPPSKYFQTILEQCSGGSIHYGGITSKEELEKNFTMNCIPLDVKNLLSENYDEFLIERRKLMAQKIKEYYYSL